MEIYEIIIIFTFIFSVITFNKRKEKIILPLFIYFISLVFIFEIFIEYYLAKLFNNNIIGYNIYSRLCNYYYLYVFIDYYKNKLWAKIYLTLIINYIIWSIIYLILNIQILKFDCCKL